MFVKYKMKNMNKSRLFIISLGILLVLLFLLACTGSTSFGAIGTAPTDEDQFREEGIHNIFILQFFAD